MKKSVYSLIILASTVTSLSFASAAQPNEAFAEVLPSDGSSAGAKAAAAKATEETTAGFPNAAEIAANLALLQKTFPGEKFSNNYENLKKLITLIMDQVSAKIQSLPIAEGSKPSPAQLEAIFTEVKGPLQVAFLNFLKPENSSLQSKADAQTKAYRFFLEAFNSVRHKFGLVPLKNSDEDCTIL
jgi:hypothetical protein